MKKILILGCPGAGKSTFARKLRDKTGLPLYYLDMIWHKPDRTTITKQEFDAKLSEIIKQEEWIIDGNYGRTLEMRFKECDTVFFLDLPTNVCLAGVEGRIGSERDDMPWQDEELSAEFRNFIINFSRDEIPEINEMLRKYKNKNIEIMTHPGNCDLELYEKSSYSLNRVVELSILCHQDIKDYIKENKIVVTNYLGESYEENTYR